MKKRIGVVLFLVLCLLAQTSAWAAAAPKKTGHLKRRIERHVGQATTTQSFQNAEEFVAKVKFPTISYQQFEEEDARVSATQAQYEEMLKDFQDAVTTEQLSKVTDVYQGTPNYGDETKGFKYIYVGEIHDEPAIEQEVKKLLRDIRESNPNKKILLATEFSNVMHPFINPLLKEGQPPIYIDEFYPSVFIDDLKMDVLSLDDKIVQMPDDKLLVKMGDRYINIPEDSEIVKRVQFLYGPEIKQIANTLLEDKNQFASMYTSAYTSPNQFLEAYRIVNQDPRERKKLSALDTNIGLLYAGELLAGQKDIPDEQFFTGQKHM